MSWLRSLNTESVSTAYDDAGQINNIALDMQNNLRHGNQRDVCESIRLVQSIDE